MWVQMTIASWQRLTLWQRWIERRAWSVKMCDLGLQCGRRPGARIAAAQLGLVRVRHARHQLLSRVLGNPDVQSPAAVKMPRAWPRWARRMGSDVPSGATGSGQSNDTQPGVNSRLTCVSK